MKPLFANVIEGKNKNTVLLIVFFLLLLLFVSLIYFTFLRKPRESNVYVAVTYKKIKIDFSTLDNPLLKNLDSYNPPSLPEKKIGTKNPFFYTSTAPETSSK